MAPRALWSGSLSFGLVNVPVRLHSAVRDHDLHFHELHAKDGARIETKRFCSKEDKEVAWEDIGHGYELDDGTQVVVTDEELEAVAPQKTHTIEISSFVDRDAIDPILLDHPYWLVPSGDGDGPKRAYRLLVEVMEQADEVVEGATLDVDTPSKAPTKQEVDMAGKLVKSLHATFHPQEEHDEYRELVLKMLKAKGEGKEIELPDETDTEATDDLLAALEASLR